MDRGIPHGKAAKYYKKLLSGRGDENDSAEEGLQLDVELGGVGDAPQHPKPRKRHHQRRQARGRASDAELFVAQVSSSADEVMNESEEEEMMEALTAALTRDHPTLEEEGGKRLKDKELQTSNR